MNVVDSSGWLEYFANGSNADFFAPAIMQYPKIKAVVPLKEKKTAGNVYEWYTESL